MASRLTPVDAQSFWMSTKIPNDTFLLFAFAGVAASFEDALAEVLARAAACAELTVRVDDGAVLSYPSWARCDVDEAQFPVYEQDTWDLCLLQVNRLTFDQLDARSHAWRLHVFPCVTGVPGLGQPGTVAVLQISHALGGGGRTALSAALMFGRRGTLPEVTPSRALPALLPLLGVRAAQAHRQLVADTDAGLVPPAAPLRPALSTNARPAGDSGVRVVALDKAQLGGPTVTVAVLAAISEALAVGLRRADQDAALLGAELMIAKPAPRTSYNHFGAAGVGLYPELSRSERMDRISSDIAARRKRAAHPAASASERAFAATPAPLLRWGIGRFDPDVRVDHVTGNTVVSSVNGGTADYAFGGVPVALLAAFPGLSPMMSLTHCVCGIGDTISVSVNASESALGEFPGALDEYTDRLRAALLAG